jgi:hypothetical protein
MKSLRALLALPMVKGQWKLGRGEIR